MQVISKIFVYIACHYIERVLEYQIGNLVLSHYLVKLNTRKDSTVVDESQVTWMKPALVINIW